MDQIIRFSLINSTGAIVGEIRYHKFVDFDLSSLDPNSKLLYSQKAKKFIDFTEYLIKGLPEELSRGVRRGELSFCGMVLFYCQSGYYPSAHKSVFKDGDYSSPVEEKVENTMQNDGGKTGYYDLPTPSAEAIGEVLQNVGLVLCPELLEILCDKIKALCPQTLNDLIEFKKMEPWQHEVFKACYAIDGRAEVKGSPRLRDIRKIKYYAERAEMQELKKPVVVEATSEDKEDRKDTGLNLLAKVHWEWAEVMNWHTGKVDTFGKLVRTIGKLIMNRQDPEKIRLILADIILKTLDIAYDSGVDVEAAIKDQIELNIGSDRTEY